MDSSQISQSFSTCLLNAGPEDTETTRAQFCSSLRTYFEVNTSHLFYQVLKLCGDKGLGLVSTLVPGPGLRSPAGDMLHFAVHVCALHTYACLHTYIPICPHKSTI